MNYIIGDIGNTSTRVCLFNKTKILNSIIFDTKNIKSIKFSNNKTSNNLIRRGLLERIFGGVGTQKELPTTPQFYNEIAANNNNATIFVIFIIGFTAGPAVSL